MIPEKTRVGQYEIVASPSINMVSVVKPGGSMFQLVPTQVKSFDVGVDGNLQECYDKAVAFAEQL